ncbi:galactoside O-acetyltransferase [Helicobacter jaachi]|uniref:Galactoside O-acetyltransferase n=2 Tax=Helicobacter jaachi TaxID=1677920 RepID=A0A4U8TAB0_9HELI|nr:galactoside O-acetyltransferase [Helicobacter jaachi]
MRAQRNAGHYTQDELDSMGFKSLGQNVLISRLARIYGASKISIGSNVRIDDFVILSGVIRLGSFVHIGAFASITGGNGLDSSVCFGDFCGMSSYSKIFATSDDFVGGYLVGPCVLDSMRNVKASHIVLTKHCHIGSHSLVLPKSRFELGACLGPMSLNMGRTLKAWAYYYGNPAKKIYSIDSAQILQKEAMLLTINGGGAELNFS